MARVLHVCTVPATLGFLANLIPHLQGRGHEVFVATSPGPKLDEFSSKSGVPGFPLEMARSIRPLADLRSLVEMIQLIRRLRPDVVHAHTPKAGLIAMLAARLTRVPHRIYHLRGLRLATTAGWKRKLLLIAERCASGSSHVTIAVSRSLADDATEQGALAAPRVEVIQSGQGVDARLRFAPSLERTRGREFRARHGLPADALVVGFVGRFARDKGMSELLEAWATVRETTPSAWLLLVGDRDDSDPFDVGSLLEDPQVRAVDFTDDTPAAYEAIDVLAFPTYREGFPNVLLEAASMEVPVVASAAVGCVDAVIEGETGFLVPVHDAAALARRLTELLENEGLRAEFGRRARQRALEEFEPARIFERVAAIYEGLLDASSPREEYS